MSSETPVLEFPVWHNKLNLNNRFPRPQLRLLKEEKTWLPVPVRGLNATHKKENVVAHKRWDGGNLRLIAFSMSYYPQ